MINEFNQLTEESKEAMDKSMPISKLTDDSLKATLEMSVINVFSQV